MDQPQNAKPGEDSAKTATPDITPAAADRQDTRPPPSRAHRSRPGRWPLAFGIGGALLGLAGLALAAFTYIQGQREILRLSTDLAQLRVSLDLYAQSNTSGAIDLTGISARLSSLEEAVQGNVVSMPDAPAAPSAPTASGPTADEDCLPSGMRLLVAAGDSYPICGQAAEVNVGFVDNGYITLTDGTSVPSGGAMPLPGSACTVAVTSSGDEGITGYAEIRVTC